MGGNYVSRLGGADILKQDQLQELDPQQLAFYNQQKEAAKTAGMRELASRLSDAFAGRDIVGRAQEREKLKAPEKGTSLMQNVQWIMSQDPNISYQEALQIAKGGTTINFGDNQEVIKYSLNELADQRKALTSQKVINDKISTVQDILLSGDVKTGWFQEKILPAKQAFNSLGIAVDENLGEAEFINATNKYLVPRMREAGSGATSDFEARTYELAAPSFAKSPEGNLFIIGTWMQTQERDKELFRLKERYIKDNKGSVFGFEDYLSELEQKGEAPRIYKQFDNPNDVETLYNKGQLKDGEVIIYNGKLEVFRKDDIIDN